MCQKFACFGRETDQVVLLFYQCSVSKHVTVIPTGIHNGSNLDRLLGNNTNNNNSHLARHISLSTIQHQLQNNNKNVGVELGQ